MLARRAGGALGHGVAGAFAGDAAGCLPYSLNRNSSRPISIRRISLVPAPIS
jgi:hypothetical protein